MAKKVQVMAKDRITPAEKVQSAGFRLAPGELCLFDPRITVRDHASGKVLDADQGHYVAPRGNTGSHWFEIVQGRVVYTAELCICGVIAVQQ